jgi:hypothetical protein
MPGLRLDLEMTILNTSIAPERIHSILRGIVTTRFVLHFSRS